jgi:hypothetical protein
MKYKRITTALLTLTVTLTAACSNQTAAPNGGANPPQTQPVSTAPADAPSPVFTAPLTGLPIKEESKKRVVLVMVNNHSKARPQSGLDKADIVYELLEEGLITRFMAFYQSQSPEVVGPVRSIRPYNVDISEGFDSIISHAGGSVTALSMLRAGSYADMDEIYSYSKAYWRVKTRKAPHNLYTSIDKLRKGAEEKGYAAEGTIPSFHFMKESDQVQGEPGTSIHVTYSKRNTAGYEYDEISKQYKRFTAEKPHRDKETGKQLTATNVLVIGARHRTIDREGRLEIDSNGPGDGYLFQHGKAMRITWERKDGAIRAYRNGTEMLLYPGTTWINVVPTAPSLASHVSFH